MRRSNKKRNFNDNFFRKEMTPWEGQDTAITFDKTDQIPTYRRQIMQKFLGTVLLRNKKSEQQLRKKVSLSDEKEQPQKLATQNTNDETKQRIKNLDSCNTFHLSHAFFNSKNQEPEKKKSVFKTSIINFDVNLIAKYQKKQFPKNGRQSQMSHAKKMKFRQIITNKKVIEKIKSKNYLGRTLTQDKNGFFLYDLVTVLSCKHQTTKNLKQPNYYLKKRPTSVQFIRSTQLF